MTKMRIIVTAAGFILIFSSGFWLQRTGQPFGTLALTIHKLLSVALIVYLVAAVLHAGKTAPLGPGGLAACLVAGALLLGAVATGGILSAVKDMPPLVRLLHQALPALAVLATAAALFLISRRG